MNKTKRMTKEEKRLQQNADRLAYVLNYKIGTPADIRVWASEIEHVIEDSISSFELEEMYKEFDLFRIHESYPENRIALRILI